MTNSTNQSRLHGLDFLRAIMMMLGVVLHTAQMYMASGLAVDYYLDASQSYSMDATLIIINTFRIPTFFLLSGFFTAMLVVNRGTRQMIKNRWKRIVIPFLIFLPLLSLIMAFLKIVARHVETTGEFGFDINLIKDTAGLLNNTHNLWFMYYLILFITVAAVLIRIQKMLSERNKARISKVLNGLPMTHWVTLFGFGVLIGLLGSSAASGRISAELSFVPSLLVFSNFGLCFLFGWLLFYRQKDIKKMERLAWWYMVIAWLSLILGFACFFVLEAVPDFDYVEITHMTLSLSTGMAIVFFMVSFVGLFSRYYGIHNARLKYLADSAYWVYLVHGVILVSLGLCLSSWNAIAEIKFLVVSSVTMFSCLITYHYWVRSTRIGVLLNGRKYPKEWPRKDKKLQ